MGSRTILALSRFSAWKSKLVHPLSKARRREIQEATHFERHLRTRSMDKMDRSQLRFEGFEDDFQRSILDRFHHLIVEQPGQTNVDRGLCCGFRGCDQ